jgi:hypothetical protein
MSAGVPARMKPWMSSRFEKIPAAGFTQVEFLFASRIKSLTFTYFSAVSLSLAIFFTA